jgi:hypothetical protein
VQQTIKKPSASARLTPPAARANTAKRTAAAQHAGQTRNANQTPHWEIASAGSIRLVALATAVKKHAGEIPAVLGRNACLTRLKRNAPVRTINPAARALK